MILWRLGLPLFFHFLDHFFGSRSLPRALDSLGRLQWVTLVAVMRRWGNVSRAKDDLAAATRVEVNLANVDVTARESASVVQLDCLIQKGHVVIDVG